MKITRKQLRQIIKEELSLIIESPTDDYLDGLRAELQGKLIDSVSQSAQTRKLELSDEGMGEIQDALIDGVFKVSEKDEEEETATLVWEVEVEDFRGALIDSGIPEDDVDQVFYNLSFIGDLSVQKGALDAVFGEGSFDGISIGDMFADSAGLMDKISQRTKTPASKKEYNGPKGKGQTRYIVTSQVTKWHSEDEADFNMSVFFLVDTADGSKFKLKGSELPKTLPSTEGPIEIFNIAPSRDRDESDLVADINGKEFRLARKDI